MITSSDALKRVKSISNQENIGHELNKIYSNFKFHEGNIFKLSICKNNWFIRARIKEVDKSQIDNLSTDLLFRQVNEISYKPESKVSSYGRCNIPQNSIFYATSIPNEKAMTDKDDLYKYLATPIFETIKRDNNKVHIVTFSVWENTERIECLNIPAKPGLYFNENNWYRQHINQFVKTFSSMGYPSAYEDPFIQYLASEIARPVDDTTGYHVTGHFVEYMLRKHDFFDGILYLSSKMSGSTPNIALRPDSVDKKLKLVDIEVRLLLIDKKDDITLIPAFRGTVDDTSTGTISYHEYDHGLE